MVDCSIIVNILSQKPRSRKVAEQDYAPNLNRRSDLCRAGLAGPQGPIGPPGNPGVFGNLDTVVICESHKTQFPTPARQVQHRDL